MSVDVDAISKAADDERVGQKVRQVLQKVAAEVFTVFRDMARSHNG